jgi:hypothetical protein
MLLFLNAIHGFAGNPRGSFTFTWSPDGTLLVPLLSRFARPAGLVTFRQTFVGRSQQAAPEPALVPRAGLSAALRDRQNRAI